MNRQAVILLALNFLIILAISIFSTNYLMNSVDAFLNNESTIELNKKASYSFNFLLFSQCFSILFASCTIPFLFWIFAPKWNIDKQNWWKSILILELTGLLISYFTTPPDFISTILIFILWQLPVVINIITLNLRIKSMNKTNNE